MYKIISISLLLMGFLSEAHAQKKIIYEDTSLLQKEEQVKAPAEDFTITDSTAVEEAPVAAMEENEPVDTTLYKNELNISYDSIKNWRNSKDYAYTKYLDSLLKNIKPKEVKEPTRPRRSFLSGLFNSDIVTVLLWTLAIGFVLFILYRFFLAEGAFKRRSKSAKNAEAKVEEEIITKESDFEALIRQAIQSSKYRQAVRYQYLRTLHLLAGKNMLALARDKTNFQYVSEISNRNHKQPFAALTLNYEYVWYGEFEIDKNIYEKIESNFRSFNQKI